MNRRIAAIWGLVTVAIAAVVGAVAYYAGTTAAGAPAADGPYPYHYGFGFFPFFGFFWLLLIGILVFGLLFRPWGRGHWGRGPWGPGGPYGLNDWHRQAHGESQTPPSGPPSSGQPSA